MKDPASEYHRVEVLYDVLLPWLANKLLPEALAEAAHDPFSDWRTPQRAGSSPYRNLWEALRYYLRQSGLSVPHLKQLSFCLRLGLMNKVQEDLITLKNGEVVQPQRSYAEVSK